MNGQFQKHYTRAEARALLPALRRWLRRLRELRQFLSSSEEAQARRLAAGEDLGGDGVNRDVRLLAELQAVLREFEQREIQIKDLERGLVDFPALVGGKEVFLCWEEGEEDVEYWHDLSAGYAGREPL